MNKEDILALIKETIKQSLRVNVYVDGKEPPDTRVRIVLLLDGEQFDSDNDKG